MRERALCKALGKEVSVVIGSIMRLLLATTIVVCCEDVDDYFARLRDKKRSMKK
jgi:hypothetical protein